MVSLIILTAVECILVLLFLFLSVTFFTQVRLWDAERKNCIGIGKGHLGAVGSVAFSKKTKNYFVSGSRFALQFVCNLCLPEVTPKLLF